MPGKRVTRKVSGKTDNAKAPAQVEYDVEAGKDCIADDPLFGDCDSSTMNTDTSEAP